MALLAHICKTDRDIDTSNDGISNRYSQVILTNVAEGSDLDAVYPFIPRAKVAKRTFGEREVFHIEPEDQRPESEGYYCAGGAYVASSDSRFSDAVGGIYGAIPLHDRFEEYR